VKSGFSVLTVSELSYTLKHNT